MQEDLTLRLKDGRRIGYALYGDPDGFPVFYFHGWPSSRYQAFMIHPHAAARGLRIIAPDRPGIGLSDPLHHRTFGAWPADVEELADHLGLSRFAVMGISGGGPYTLAAAARLQDRVVAAAVLCGAPPLSEPEYRKHLHWAYRTLIGLKRLRRAATSPILITSRWMVDRGPSRAPMSWMMRSLPPEDRIAIDQQGGWEMVTRSYIEAIRAGADSIVDEGELYIRPWDFDPSSIRIPVAFWHGTADRNLPCAAAQLLARHIPGAIGHWPENEGHYSLSVRFSPQALDWLRKSAL